MMNLPFGEIIDRRLVMHFSSDDYTLATVIGAIRERYDMLRSNDVNFMGVSTENDPTCENPDRASINAYFDYLGEAQSFAALCKVYVLVWEAITMTFSAESQSQVQRSKSAGISQPESYGPKA